MPTGPLKTDKFTAVNTSLKYSEGWDSPWPVGIGADVVRFEETPGEFVFWKGADYQPHFDTSRGHWFNNRVNEGGNEHGSCEPMSDKQTRHVHVKVLEKKMPALLCNGAMFWLITGIDSHFMIRRQVEVIVVIYFKPIKCEILKCLVK